MDLRQLEAFVAVATQLSFKAAANRLNLSQPAISSRITAFEAELGKTLFKRDTKPVTLTDDAVRMLPHAERILEIFNDMLPASATKPPRSRLSIVKVTWGLYLILAFHSFAYSLVERATG